MVTKVLVPLDGSPAAETILPYVELIASRTGASLHLLTVIHGPEAEASRVSKAFAYLERTADDLSARGLSCSKETTAGSEAEVILTEAASKGADLIAMSTHGRSGLARWVLGSIADKVVHGTSKPLLLVRAHDSGQRPLPQIDRILVPLDGSELSMSVLPYVEEMARALAAELVLYSAVPPLDIYPGTEMTPGRVGDIIDDLLHQAQSFLGTVAKEVDGRGKVKARTVATIGFPVDEILRVAEEVKAGLIAVATHGRSGLNRWVMGSVADGVVRRSPFPCLLVRPVQAVEEER